jgi:hypothetical protein
LRVQGDRSQTAARETAAKSTSVPTRFPTGQLVAPFRIKGSEFISISGQLLLLTYPQGAGHTIGMKVAVSIPDDVFAEAEALAKRMKSSRSEIYSRALGEFIGHHAPDRVTDLMNEVVDVIGEGPDAFAIEAARRVLKKVDW